MTPELRERLLAIWRADQRWMPRCLNDGACCPTYLACVVDDPTAELICVGHIASIATDFSRHRPGKRMAKWMIGDASRLCGRGETLLEAFIDAIERKRIGVAE